MPGNHITCRACFTSEQARGGVDSATLKARHPFEIGTVPTHVAVVTAAADVQGDRVEVTVVGWGARKETWIIDHIVLVGRTSEDTVWRDLDEVLDRDWPRADGGTMRIARLSVDSGCNTAKVYECVRSKPKVLVIAVKGRESLDAALAAPKITEINVRGQRIKRGVRLWQVGVNVIKADLQGRLRLAVPTDDEIRAHGYPAGWIHFPMFAENYFKQVCAEACIVKASPMAPTKVQWVKQYPANEAWDCLVYNVAAYMALGCHRWPENRWGKSSKSHRSLEWDVV